MSSRNKTKRLLAAQNARTYPRRRSVRRARQRLACMPYTRKYTEGSMLANHGLPVRKWSKFSLGKYRFRNSR